MTRNAPPPRRSSRIDAIAFLSFGGYGLDELGQERLSLWRDWLFLTTESTRQRAGSLGNVQNIGLTLVSYVDIMAASDAVVTKPGFGIVSDALVNRVPVLYSDRGEFREYAVYRSSIAHVRPSQVHPPAWAHSGVLGPYLDAADGE